MFVLYLLFYNNHNIIILLYCNIFYARPAVAVDGHDRFFVTRAQSRGTRIIVIHITYRVPALRSDDNPGREQTEYYTLEISI